MSSLIEHTQQKFTADRLPQNTVRRILLWGYFYVGFDGCLLSLSLYAIALTLYPQEGDYY